jgi:hypothetical protein
MRTSALLLLVVVIFHPSSLTGAPYQFDLSVDHPFPLVLLDQEAIPAEHTPWNDPWGDYPNIRINQDETTQLQNEEQVAVNPTNPNNLVAVWRDFRLGYRRVGVGYSFDGGMSWTEDLFEDYHYPRHSDPGVTVDLNGNFYAVILSYENGVDFNGLFVYKSTDGGVTWGDPVTVIDSVLGYFEDKELMACDRSDGPYSGNLYVCWTRFGYDTEILCCRSTDGGESFVGPSQVSDYGGVQWPVPMVGTNSEVYIAWVNYWPTSILFDVSYDGGQTFGTDQVLTDCTFYPGDIKGGIWVFPFPALEADITGGPHDGRLYCAYMDDSPGFTDTDIYFRYSTDGGATWTARQRINDDDLNNGCDQFHPWTHVDQNGVITVTWLDRRLDPQNYKFDCYITQSYDGGATFTPNIRISTVSSDPREARAGLLGEYIGLATHNGRVNPVWTDTRNGHQDAYTARIFTYPDVEVTVVPADTVVPRGGTLECTITVHNLTGATQRFWTWADVIMPDDTPYGKNPVLGPQYVTLGPGATKQKRVTHKVPLKTPLDTYAYVIRIGPDTETVSDEDFFLFRVSASGYTTPGDHWSTAWAPVHEEPWR